MIVLTDVSRAPTVSAHYTIAIPISAAVGAAGPGPPMPSGAYWIGPASAKWCVFWPTSCRLARWGRPPVIISTRPVPRRCRKLAAFVRLPAHMELTRSSAGVPDPRCTAPRRDWSRRCWSCDFSVAVGCGFSPRRAHEPRVLKWMPGVPPPTGQAPSPLLAPGGGWSGQGAREAGSR
jgi:hypothetical protein